MEHVGLNLNLLVAYQIRCRGQGLGSKPETQQGSMGWNGLPAKLTCWDEAKLWHQLLLVPDSAKKLKTFDCR